MGDVITDALDVLVVVTVCDLGSERGIIVDEGLVVRSDLVVLGAEVVEAVLKSVLLSSTSRRRVVVLSDVVEVTGGIDSIDSIDGYICIWGLLFRLRKQRSWSRSVFIKGDFILSRGICTRRSACVLHDYCWPGLTFPVIHKFKKNGASLGALVVAIHPEKTKEQVRRFRSEQYMEGCSCP